MREFRVIMKFTVYLCYRALLTLFPEFDNLIRSDVIEYTGD